MRNKTIVNKAKIVKRLSKYVLQQKRKTKKKKKKNTKIQKCC